MRLISRRRKNQRGDTIVEVLIAIGIVSLVLTTAYNMSNRNRQTMQNTREQTQAQKLVEGQIELLREQENPSNMSNKCFVRIAGEGGDTEDLEPRSTSDNQCLVDANGYQAASDYSGAKYSLSINYSSSNVYTIKATWDKLGGGTGNVTMYYSL